MSEKWYQFYLDKIKESDGGLIIVIDHDNISTFEDITEPLKTAYLLHQYRSEFSLRSFLNKNIGERIIVFKTSEFGYLPYDIEATAMIVVWQLKDIFTKLDITSLKNYQLNQYQSIYEGYRNIEKSLNEVFEQETNNLINDWLKTTHQSTELTELKDLAGEIRCLLNEQSIDWIGTACIWGRVSYLNDLIEDNDMVELKEIDNMIALRFQEHILSNYHDLFYESYVSTPVTIDKVMHHIGTQPGDKKVIICFDGMGFQEWHCLKKYLSDKGIDKFNENAVYALLPTLTKISRRALFSGLRRIETLTTTTEDNGFRTHVNTNWQNGNNKAKKVILSAPVTWSSDYLEYDYLGIIINLIDDIAHSTVLIAESKRAMQNSFTTILKETEIDKILSEFLLHGYRIYILSDHGSVWCRGNGLHAEKYIVEERAKRALVYPNKILAEEFCRGKDLLLYNNQHVSGNNVLVFPKFREMFARANDLVITHGGIHIEEVIVPFIEVIR
ncbi:PglZ domain-containing protein [Candidatus Omnitrophota bacterium]